MRESHRNFFLKIFKYLPTAFTGLLVTHLMFLLNGITVPFTQYLVDSSFLGGGLLITSSMLFDMCVAHKICIWYTIIVTLLMDVHKMFNLGMLLWPFRLVAFIVGILALLGILFNFIWKKK